MINAPLTPHVAPLSAWFESVFYQYEGPCFWWFQRYMGGPIQPCLILLLYSPSHIKRNLNV